MIDTLATFAIRSRTVARRSGRRGKLGARETCGRRRDMARFDDNVNRLAANLTRKLRAIADVATAVTKGISRDHSGGGAGRGRFVKGQHQRDDP